MKNEILHGEYREIIVSYRKPFDPNYQQIKERGMRGEIGRHPDFNIRKFSLNQHRRIEEILREVPLSLKAEEIASGNIVYPPLAVSPFYSNRKIRYVALTPVGKYQNYLIPEINKKVKEKDMQDEPGMMFGEVFIINDRTFISPYGDEVEIKYRIFSRKSTLGNDVFRTIELHLDGVPRSDFFDF